VIIFDSVRFLLKKNNQTEKKKILKKPKPNRNRFKPTGFGSVRFLGQKPVQTGWLGFFGFGSVWLVFFRFGSVFSRFFSVWVRFGFFGFLLIKPNRTGRFFQNFNQFNRVFFTVRFFRLFVFRCFGFFTHPYHYTSSMLEEYVN
jgi:hypothetical protein